MHILIVMSTTNEIQLYKNLLKHSFNGTPWFGPSLIEQLEKISPELASKRMSVSRKNIAEYLMHIITWRKFTIEKLKGNADYTIEISSEADWPPVPDIDTSIWNNMLTDLKATQEELLGLLENFDPAKLDEPVPGAKYKYKIMLSGLVQHDIYHSGQVGLLKSLLTS